jgi:hypothetical protein
LDAGFKVERLSPKQGFFDIIKDMENIGGKSSAKR